MKGKPRTTGAFDTRKELEEYVYVQSVGNLRGSTDISRSAKVSSTTVENILKKIKPSIELQIEALECKVLIKSRRGECVDFFEERIMKLRKLLDGDNIQEDE